jgi:hypothetical protein
MSFKITMYYFKNLYIFFTILALTIFFFSTTKVKANAFEINNIEISKPFKNNFNKNLVINIGFKKAFFELINSLIKSTDLKKVDDVRLNEIQSMVESFSIKEEKFVNKIYYVNLGVSFDKKKIFNYLEKKNIFPTQIVRETFLFIPIIIDEDINDLSIFSNNQIYENWNKSNKKSQLINYLLPTEDLEDMNLIKSKFNVIEEYDFKEIIDKYYLSHSIVSLIFKNENEIKILSKMNIQNNISIKNNSFKKISLKDERELDILIQDLKILYDDLWKEYNQINTSIKLPLLIRVENKDLVVSLNFESTLDQVDLVNSYSIDKFDNDYIYYKLIFNGTPKNFINIMSKKNYSFDIQKKIWLLK